MNELNKTLRLLRQQKEWSQEDIAKRIGVSIPAYSKMESGITNLNLFRLEQISSLFNMSIVDLLTFGDPSHHCNDSQEIAILEHTIKEYQLEIAFLQRKIIELHEEIRKK